MTDVAVPEQDFMARRAAHFMATGQLLRAKPKPMRVLTASAQKVNLADRNEAMRLRQLRQTWQQDAWNFYDEMPEISFAFAFVGNCFSRIKFFPAAYPGDTEDENPVALSVIPGVPPEVLESATNAFARLGSARARSQLFEMWGINFGIAGECWLLGLENPDTGIEEWTIRSILEMGVRNDHMQLRELPSDPNGQEGWIDIDEQNAFVSRMWIPHPGWQKIARSGMRGVLSVCDELQILSRGIRASGRSRLTGAGIFFVPDTIDIAEVLDDNEDPFADPFTQRLGDTMMQAISEEGQASAMVPIMLRGPETAGAAMRRITFEQATDSITLEQRKELIGRIGVGIDLPASVLNGMGDLNHWTAWEVSDDTFREHLEPGVQRVCDAATVGYLRISMLADAQAQGWPDELRAWIPRVCTWYDSTELVTHPDKSADALALHTRLVISDAALRKATGFNESDAPGAIEVELRMVRDTRTFPPNVLEALFHVLDPELVIPPMAAGTIPGMGKDGATAVAVPEATAPVDASTVVPGPPDPAVPDTSAITAAALIAAVKACPPEAAHVKRMLIFWRDAALANEGTTASGAKREQSIAHARKLSRSLAEMDRDLRTRLQVLANSAIRRMLERAGARARSSVMKDERLKEYIKMVPNERVVAALGRSVTAALNISGLEIATPDWSDVKAAWDEWVPAVQEKALATALQLGGKGIPTEARDLARAALADNADAGWSTFETTLTSLAQSLLYDPHPGADPNQPWGDLSPNSLVPTGQVRAALAVAGGAPAEATLIDGKTKGPQIIAGDVPVGQIGTGTTISNLISSSPDVEQQGFTWVHGPAAKPFEPHEDLDGTTFATFDDDVLLNTSGFPDNEYFTPGDHDGCTCDYTADWLPSPDSENYPLPDDGGDDE